MSDALKGFPLTVERAGPNARMDNSSPIVDEANGRKLGMIS